MPTMTLDAALKNGPQNAILAIVRASYLNMPYPIDVNMFDINPPVIVLMIV